MRFVRRALSIIAGGLLLPAAAAQAHHSFAGAFDASQPMELNGTVTRMEWINPHALIHIAVKGPDGQVESWEVEIAAPTSLFRRGWTRNSVPAGATVVLFGYRAKDPGVRRLNGLHIVFADGRRLFSGEPGTGAPEGPIPTRR